MARLDYSVSVTPVQSTSFEGQTIEAVEADVGRTLSASTASSTWTAGTVTWSSNNAGHKQSRTTANTIATVSTTNGLWIKHTGFKYVSGLSTVAEITTIVTVSRMVTAAEWIAGGGTNAGNTATAVQVAKLRANEGVFIPTTGVATWTLTDDAGGQAVAVEYAELR